MIGCGTSLYMGQAWAALREARGHGRTDAFAASELPAGRAYDVVVALSRSGTTTEVAHALARAGGARTVAITAVAGTPVADAADDVVLLDFADEASVVQTRFATTALTLLRAHEGVDVAAAAADAERALQMPLPVEPGAADRWAFLGRGWTVGLAHEAALKLREAAQAWTESYPVFEYRHGPISIAGPGAAVWFLGAARRTACSRACWRPAGRRWRRTWIRSPRSSSPSGRRSRSPRPPGSIPTIPAT